jgi:hypothetical protein
MEYKDVRYTIRTGIERGQWLVVLHPPGNEFPEEKRVSGTRKSAERKARSMINAWLQRRDPHRWKKPNISRTKPCDESWRIAPNIAKLPELLRKP